MSSDHSDDERRSGSSSPSILAAVAPAAQPSHVQVPQPIHDEDPDLMPVELIQPIHDHGLLPSHHVVQPRRVRVSQPSHVELPQPIHDEDPDFMPVELIQPIHDHGLLPSHHVIQPRRVHVSQPSHVEIPQPIHDEDPDFMPVELIQPIHDHGLLPSHHVIQPRRVHVRQPSHVQDPELMRVEHIQPIHDQGPLPNHHVATRRRVRQLSHVQVPQVESRQPASSTHATDNYSPDVDEFGTYRIHRLRAVQEMLEVIDSTYMPYVGLGIEIPGNEDSRRYPEPLFDPHGPVDPHEDNENSPAVSSAGEESNHSDPEVLPLEDPLPRKDVVKEPPAKLRKTKSDHEDTDGETCPICLDTWGNVGTHRLVSLKCGHLFGAECVERWLNAQEVKNRSCPTCKSKASVKDIRCIYARRIVTADTTEISRLRLLVDSLQANKCRNELNLQAAKISQRALVTQLENLKKKIASYQAAHKGDKNFWRFALEKNLEVNKDGGCRVLTYNCRSFELYVSQKSANYLFPGYGIRKVSCVDHTLGQFVHLHTKPIRGITYSQPNDLLLTVSLDGTAKIVERGMPNVTLNVGSPLWSCAWDHHRPNEFYIGGFNGTIQQYDVRNLSKKMTTLTGASDKTPVVSLWSTQSGILSCHLNSCWIWESVTGKWVPKIFPTNGACLSMCYDEESQRALVTMRAKPPVERSKLTLCSLTPTPEGGTDVVVDYVINGSARTTYMAKSTFCRAPGATWVAVHSESDSTLYLHGLDGSRTMSLPASETALDVLSTEINGRNVLASLSETRLRIYKAV